MTDQTDKIPAKGAQQKTLRDGDIATFSRRNGPAHAAGHGTDVDTHSDVDTTLTGHQTDHDTGPVAHKAGTDKDT